MPVIRIKDTDKERFDFMRGLIPATSFFTLLVDRYEQPEEVKEEPKQKRPNPELKKKPVHPEFKSMKDTYMNTWKNNNGFEYQWNGPIDASALNRLIKSLENINESDCSVGGFFEIIMRKLPAFYKDKSLNAINKNLNGIIADIKNGGNKTSEIPNIGKYDFRS